MVEQLICNQLVGGSSPSAGSISKEPCMPGYLYVLQSEANGHYYVGSCIDPDRRLTQHNANAVAATHGKGPWVRAVLLEFPDSGVARKAEMFIKRQKSRRIIEKIISKEFIWPEGFDQ